jgi:hypothetical protein
MIKNDVISTQRDNLYNPKRLMAFTRKVYYTSEFRFWGVFLVCELWYYYNIMIFQKVKREI